MDRADIIKSLECCATVGGCKECPRSVDGKYCNEKTTDIIKSALNIIGEQDAQIFELENRLKECENGYEGTLYLERCKLHDAEEKVEKLTADYDGLNKGVNELLIIGASAFAERVKKLFDGFDTVQSEIDGVLNEMKGEILC